MSGIWSKENILKTEAEFQAATPEGKRVMVALDVISSIRMRKIIPTTGMFVDMPDDIKDWDRSSDLRSELIRTQNHGSCSCCGLGALFVCMVLRDDKVSADVITNMNHIDQNTTFEKLEEFFDRFQVRMIEAAFEMGQGVAGSMYGTGAKEFGRLFEEDDDRMIAIMNNIAKNNGEFKPLSEPGVLKALENGGAVLMEGAEIDIKSAYGRACRGWGRPLAEDEDED